MSQTFEYVQTFEYGGSRLYWGNKYADVRDKVSLWKRYFHRGGHRHGRALGATGQVDYKQQMQEKILNALVRAVQKLHTRSNGFRIILVIL